MKIKLIFSFIIFIAITLLSFSCNSLPDLMELEEAERADRLFDIVNEIEPDSCLIALESDIKGSISGMELETHTESDSYYYDLSSTEPITHFEVNAQSEVFYSKEDSIKQNLKRSSGFRNGKMYLSASASSSLYSKISAEEYFEFLESTVTSRALAIANLHKSGSVKKCTQNEDGSWHASFSGFSEDATEELISSYFDYSVLTFENASVRDILFEIEADKKLRLTEMRYTIIFDGDASATASLRLHDLKEEDLPQVNLYKYTEVSDLRFLYSVRSMLSEKLLSGSEKVTMTDIVNSRGDIPFNHQEAESDLSFESKDNKFTFTYHYPVSSVSESTASISYKDGTLTSANSALPDSSMTDSEARAYALSVIDAGDFLNAPISGYEKQENEEDTYIFYIKNPSLTDYYSITSTFPAQGINSSAKLRIVLKDGDIAEYYYTFSMQLSYMDFNAVISQSNLRIFE